MCIAFAKCLLPQPKLRTSSGSSLNETGMFSMPQAKEENSSHASFSKRLYMSEGTFSQVSVQASDLQQWPGVNEVI